MASVAICPHCYLQLMVPDGVPRDACVACPTCAKSFDLNQAVLRAIPEISVVKRDLPVPASATVAAMTTVAEAEVEVEGPLGQMADELPLEAPVEETAEVAELQNTTGQGDAEVAAWFRQHETTPDVEGVETGNDVAETPVEDRSPWETDQDDSRDEPVHEVTPSEVRSAAVTLADLLPPREEPEPMRLGPTFDLPNVPLSPESGATVELESPLSFGVGQTEFELDDVDFETVPAGEEVEAGEDSLQDRELDFTSAAPAPFIVPKVPRARKNRSVIRTFLAVALGGVIGLSLGYYILLYVLGPEGDFLTVANHLPRAVLPATFESEPAQPETTPSTSPAAVANAADEETKNVPAAYAEELPSASESLVTDEPAEENSITNEPSPLAEPEAKPIAVLEPLPLSGPTFTAEQLADALDAGESVRDGLVNGDLSDASVRRTKGMSYAKLCDLVQAFVFLDRSTPTDEAEELKVRMERLFRIILADEHTRHEVGRIAAIWIDSPHRRHGGIFVAGKISGGQIAGDVYEHQLVTEDGATLVVLLREPLDPSVDSSGQPLGIMGTIVDDPAAEVAGYQGTASRAIWVASAIPLE